MSITTRTEVQKFLNAKGPESFREHCYEYAKICSHACILDSCGIQVNSINSGYNLLCAFGSERVLQQESWEMELRSNQDDWYFGIFGYDLKNQYEELHSLNPDSLGFEQVVLFVPELIIAVSFDNDIKILKGEVPSEFFNEIQVHASEADIYDVESESKDGYLKKINEIQALIREGDVYELNYCRETRGRAQKFDPYYFQQKLLRTSPVPMAAFVKSDGHYLCSASMERFLRLLGNRIMSQPIKGTRGRSVEMASDQALKLELSLSLKDRAENVMIVDLVRNDLARVCETGSIAVPELFGVYTFEHVHQMISTVEGILKPEMKLPDILRATFPMGSMTGTPKIAAMKHIEYLEDFKRSWYAGSAGYIKPGGDFDLNVIIRSLCYNHETEMISYASGGAITIDSRPEEEWEECLVKARAIEGILFDKGIVSL